MSEMLIGRIPLFLRVCCLSLQTKGWLGPCHQVSIHPQSSHQQGKPDFQVFHPHLLDCCPLTCANMKERDGEKVGGKE